MQARLHSLLRKDVLQTFGGFLHETLCCGMPFDSDHFLMAQKLKYGVNNAKQARYWSFASFV